MSIFFLILSGSIMLIFAFMMLMEGLKHCAIPALYGIVALSWVAASSFAEYKVDKIVIVKPDIVHSGNSTCKVILVTDLTHDFINLNEKFQREIPDGSMVKIIYYKQRYYYGISYNGTVSAKLELIDPVK